MTKEELGEIMDNSNFFIDSENPYDIKILEALEKQIPKKPYKESLADYLCSVCGAYLSFDALNDSKESAPKHCSNCGQAIDWSDTKCQKN